MLTLIFDFDGTLADSLPVIWEIIDELLQANNLPPLTKKQQKIIQNKSPREIINQWHIPLVKIPLLLAKGKKIMNEKMQKIHPVVGIIPVLKKLRQKGTKMGIVSSNSLANIQLFLTNYHLELFDFIEKTSFFNKKNVLIKTLAQQRLSLNNTVYIGDEVRDIQACQAIGLRIIAVSWGFNSESKLAAAKPDFLINKPQDILTILTGLEKNFEENR